MGKEMVPQQSFFQFFQKQDIPPPEELEETIQHDYEIGCLLKEKILHDAVGWFTGEAEDSDEETDEEEETDDEDDDEDDDSDEDSSPRRGGKKFLKSTKPPQAITGPPAGGSIFDKPAGEKKEDCKQQ